MLQIRNMSELHWDLGYLFFELGPMMLMIVVSELLIDYLKHIFILRFVFSYFCFYSQFLPSAKRSATYSTLILFF